jgi:hypothetical protein
MCAELIQAAATKCRHCGEWLRSLGPETVSWAGDLLRVHRSFPLPPRTCFLCGAQGARKAPRSFVYTPPWVYVLAFSPLLLVIVAALIRRRAEVRLPLCAPCLSRWRWTRVVVGFVALGSLFLAPYVGWTVGEGVGGDGGALVGAVVGGVVWLVLLVVLDFLARGVQARCVKIEGDVVTLRFPRPDVVRAALEAGDDED